MHHAFLDEFRNIDSPLKKVPVKIKLVLLITYILAVVLTPIQFFWFFILYAFIAAAMVVISRLPLNMELQAEKPNLSPAHPAVTVPPFGEASHSGGFSPFGASAAPFVRRPIKNH